MKIYTSYFAKINQLPESIIPISIAGKAPSGLKILEYKKLAPKWHFFQEWKVNQDNNFYIEHFQKEVLDKLNRNQVLIDLANLSNGKDIVLICYEKPGNFCHRHLVAEWLDSHIEEYQF